MPSLGFLKCQLKWVGGDKPLAEHKTAYHDSRVETWVGIPPVPTPFWCHVTTTGWIAEGLSIFVYMDGEYMMNRAKINIKPPMCGSQPNQSNLSFKLRQKEVTMADGRHWGMPWAFAKVNAAPANTAIPENIPWAGQHVGTIEIVVLRHAPESSSISRGLAADNPPRDSMRTAAASRRTGPPRFGIDGATDDAEGRLPEPAHSMCLDGWAWQSTEAKPASNAADNWGGSAAKSKKSSRKSVNNDDQGNASFKWGGGSNFGSRRTPAKENAAPGSAPVQNITINVASGASAVIGGSPAGLVPGSHESNRTKGTSPPMSETGWGGLKAGVSNESHTSQRSKEKMPGSWDYDEQVNDNAAPDADGDWGSPPNDSNSKENSGWNNDADKADAWAGDNKSNDANSRNGDWGQANNDSSSKKQPAGDWGDSNDNQAAASGWNNGTNQSFGGGWGSSNEQAKNDSGQDNDADTYGAQSNKAQTTDDANNNTGDWGSGNQAAGQYVPQVEITTAAGAKIVLVNNSQSTDKMPTQPNVPQEAVPINVVPPAQYIPAVQAQPGLFASVPGQPPQPYWSAWKREQENKAAFSRPVFDPRAGAQPVYSLPDNVIKRNSTTHQVQLGAAQQYTRKRFTPKYLDTMERPFAVFTFNYRDEATLSSMFGIQAQETREEEAERFKTLSHDDLIRVLYERVDAATASKDAPVPQAGPSQNAPVPQASAAQASAAPKAAGPFSMSGALPKQTSNPAPSPMPGQTGGGLDVNDLASKLSNVAASQKGDDEFGMPMNDENEKPKSIQEEHKDVQW